MSIRNAEKKKWWNIHYEKISDSLEPTVSLFDGVMKVVEILGSYQPGISQATTLLELPLLNIQIDVKSLWILVEVGWNQFILNMVKGKASHKLTHVLPEWLSTMSKSFSQLMRYQYYRAQQLHPDDFPQQAKYLFTEIGSLDRKRLRCYATAICLCFLIEKIHLLLQDYKFLLSLLPEKKLCYISYRRTRKYRNCNSSESPESKCRISKETPRHLKSIRAFS